MTRAMYYEKIGDQVHCLLCPHNCRISEGKRGICGVREHQEGELYSLTDGKISSWGYDPIEKKPLSFFRKGSVIFSIGSLGCNFHCDFCQNFRLLDPHTQTRTVSDEELIEAAKQYGSIGIAYTYNEPLVNYEMVLRLSKKMRKEGLVNVVVTNGYIELEPLRELLPYIDAWNIDYKFSEPLYRDISGGQEDIVLRTIKEANASSHVEVTTLLQSGRNTGEEVFQGMVKKLAEIDPEIPLHLSRYYPAFKCSLPATPIEEMFRCYEIAKKYMKNVELGNMPL